MKINVDETELSAENYNEFMNLLDYEFILRYPNQLPVDYRHSETCSKEDWLEDSAGKTIDEIISDEVSHWEED